MTTDDDGSEPRGLDEVIDDFVRINDELQALGETAQELRSTIELLEAARGCVALAAAEAATRYDEAVSTARALVEKSTADNRASLEGLIESLLRTAESQKDTAARLMEELRTVASDALESAQRDHRNTASRLQDVLTSLKDSGRHLADTAAAFRQLDPEAMQQQVDAIRHEARRIKIEGRIAIGSVVVAVAILLVALT